MLGVSPLSWAVGLYEADDGGSGQGLRGKDAPLQLDAETCERIAPQDDFACFHMVNLPPRADRAGRQRHCGGGHQRETLAEKWQISGAKEDCGRQYNKDGELGGGGGKQPDGYHGKEMSH